MEFVKAQYVCCWTVAGGERCNQPAPKKLYAICRRNMFSEQHFGHLCKKHRRSNTNRKYYKTFRTKILANVKAYQDEHKQQYLEATHKRSRDYNGRLGMLFAGLKRKHSKRVKFQLCDLRRAGNKLKQYHILFKEWEASQWQDDYAPVLVSKNLPEITLGSIFFCKKIDWYDNSRKKTTPSE